MSIEGKDWKGKSMKLFGEGRKERIENPYGSLIRKRI